MILQTKIRITKTMMMWFQTGNHEPHTDHNKSDDDMEDIDESSKRDTMEAY